MRQDLNLIMGCDFAAYDFKCEILKAMRANGYTITDVGCDSAREGLYAPIAKKVADGVAKEDYGYGLLFCGTGQGMAMAANKVPGARAALCYDVFPAVLSKEHNNANILCTGAWMIQVSDALRMIEAWLFAQYAGNNDAGMELMAIYEKEGRNGDRNG